MTMTLPSAPTLLVVDDDPDIRDLVGSLLRQDGYGVLTVGDGGAMRRVLAETPIDLVILDLMLPDQDGWALCREIRQSRSIPVIFLTAAGGESDRVTGLDMGADDYLAKPFSSRELLARIRAVLRRAAPAAAGRGLRFSGWRLETARRQLFDPDGVLVDLSGAEYELLWVLLQNPQVVLSREQLLEETRGRVAGPFDRTIDVQVARLRRKIEADPKAPELIKTVRGGGYVLASNVSIDA
jgi:two-component system OmpR family response regulator